MNSVNRSRWFPRWRELHWVHLGLLTALPIYWLMQKDAARSATSVLLIWLAVVLVTAMIAERLLPYRQHWHPDGPDHKRDGSLFTLNVVADGLADVAIAAAAIWWIAAPSSWPLVVQIVVGLLAAELGSYALHRVSHGSNWLWDVHVIHHLPTALNASNSFNAHPLNALFGKLARMAPLLPMGLSADAILFILLFGLLQSVIVHANIRGRLGVLNLIVGSSELHRLHHSSRLIEAGNYGTSLPAWDLVFGSFRFGPDPQLLGVQDPGKYPSPRALKDLLRFPLRRRRAATESARPRMA